jgi:hypothetical protein
MARWETHRGDEWWYSDGSIEAGASANIVLAPPVFQMSVRSRTPGGLNSGSLLHLLRLTHEQLPEFELWCSVDRETAPLLSELAARGRVKWDLIEGPHSRDARIVEVAQDASATYHANEVDRAGG